MKRKEIQGFTIYKTKWYIITILGRENDKRFIDAQCNTKEQAECLADELDLQDIKMYHKMQPRYIVRGEQIPIWFR